MHTLFSPLLKEVLRHVHYSVAVLLDEIQKGINKQIKAILKVYRMFQLLIKKMQQVMINIQIRKSLCVYNKSVDLKTKRLIKHNYLSIFFGALSILLNNVNFFLTNHFQINSLFSTI